MNCRGYNAFGRRRRREISKNDNGPDDDALESAQRGQLREEITIESNAILTFERREERLMDPTEGTLYNNIALGYYHNITVYIILLVLYTYFVVGQRDVQGRLYFPQKRNRTREYFLLV